MNRINAVDFIKENLIKEKIIELLGSLGAKHITTAGNQIRSTCPIHHGDSPTAFIWNFDNNLWYCFTGENCGGGDIFDLVFSVFDCEDFDKAVEKTAELLGIDIANMEISNTDIYRKEQREWLEYISKKKMKDIVNTEFDIKKLGDLYKLNEYRGISKDKLNEFGVYYNKTMNRILFSIRNEKGVIVGASLRRCNSSENSKWIHRPKSIRTGNLLYNLDYCIKRNFKVVYIVEGIIDVITLNMLGLENVVASFGANLTVEQVLLLVKHFELVNLMYDNDKAGDKATRKAIELLKNLMKIRIVKYDVKDPGELTSVDNLEYIRHYEYE